MGQSIGVMTAERIAAGLVDGDKLTGLVRYFPEDPEITDALQGMPAESIAQCIRDQIETVARREQIDAIGIGLPGVIQRGIIEDSPNLQPSHRR
jgi:predicted NBD/HSP70 family sugar kinase